MAPIELHKDASTSRRDAELSDSALHAAVVIIVVLCVTGLLATGVDIAMPSGSLFGAAIGFAAGRSGTGVGGGRGD